MQAAHERWGNIVDNARYLDVEHRHKEKEYGIKWRTAFKIELEKQYDSLVLKYGNPIENNQTWNGDHLEVVQAIVEKDFKDVLTFANGKQYDLIEMLNPNLEEYEKVCTLLRKLLKNPNLHNEIIETMPYDIKTKYLAELEKKAKEEKMKADKIAKEKADKEAKEKEEKEAKEKKEKE